MGKELPAINNYTWHILFRVLTTTAQPGQDTVFKYSRSQDVVGRKKFGFLQFEIELFSSF